MIAVLTCSKPEILLTKGLSILPRKDGIKINTKGSMTAQYTAVTMVKPALILRQPPYFFHKLQ